MEGGNVMNIDGVSTGIVLDHIQAGKSLLIYQLLELENLIRNYLNVYVGRNFKSLEILETIV